MARRLLDASAMRFSWLILVGGASVVGLAGCRSQNIDDRANEKLSDERSYAQRNARYPTCPDRGVIDGNCGLILKRASTEDFRVKFRDSKCVGKEDAGCEALFQKMIDSWLIKRYPLADWREVGLTCDGDPGRCDDPVQYELLLVDSHNVRIRDESARAENEIEREREHAQSQHAAAQLNTAVAVASVVAVATHRGPVCHSYPSVFEGVTHTVCSP